MEIEERNKLIRMHICEFLLEGMCKRDAARMAGISEDTLMRWYKLDADFAEDVEASILAYKRSLIQKVNNCAVTNGKLALEILRIRWPQEWDITRKIQHEATNTTTTKEIADMLQAMLREGRESQKAIDETSVLQNGTSEDSLRTQVDSRESDNLIS